MVRPAKPAVPTVTRGDVWLAALEHGARPDDMVLDAPLRIGKWSPADFERRYLGEITVEEALSDYGVVIDRDGRIDAAATAGLRSS